MLRSWKPSDEERGGMTGRQFIRYHLLRLKLGNDLTHITRGGVKRLIAPMEEVLVLRPLLQVAR
jgi:hypothetical protein